MTHDNTRDRLSALCDALSKERAVDLLQREIERQKARPSQSSTSSGTMIYLDLNDFMSATGY